jgi:hypothetical protein
MEKSMALEDIPLQTETITKDSFYKEIDMVKENMLG